MGVEETAFELIALDYHAALALEKWRGSMGCFANIDFQVGRLLLNVEPNSSDTIKMAVLIASSGSGWMPKVRTPCHD